MRQRLLSRGWFRGFGLVLCAVATGSGVAAWRGSIWAQEREPAIVVPEEASQLSTAFRQVAEKLVPAVVTIETRTRSRPVQGRMPDRRGEGENPFEGTPFEDFFREDSPFGRRFEGEEGLGQRGQPRRDGMGSGVIIDAKGIILTNNHVVEGADEVIVRLSDGRDYKAHDVHTDPETDLAVLTIDAEETLPFATLGDSNDLNIGDWVVAIGNPFGLDSTVSAGIISGMGRELGGRRSFLQTDAAINPGNSGGPLVNLKGEVIGINTAIASNSGGYQGIGFAIPSDLAQWVTSQLIENGTVQRAYLGVTIAEVDARLARQLEVRRGEGVVVGEILPGSPAAKAGFQEGDLITHFGGAAVRKPRDLQERVERSPPGSTQELSVLRDGNRLTLEVELQPLPDRGVASGRPTPDAPAESADYSHEDLGLDLTDLTEELAAQFNLTGQAGVLIRQVRPGSLAQEAGLSPGMLILKVGKKRVQSVDQFATEVAEQNLEDGLLLLVRTPGGNRFVVIEKQG